MSDLKRLTRYLLRYRTRLLSAALAAILAASCFGGALGLVNPLLESMIPHGARAGDGQPVARGDGAAPVGRDAVSPGAQPHPVPEPALSSKEKKIDALLPDWARQAKAQVKAFFAPAQAWLMADAKVRIPLIIVLLYAGKALLFFYADYSFRRVGLRATALMRQELYSRSVQQSDLFFLRHSTGEMLSRILGDVSRLQSILGSDIGQMTQSIPMAIGSLIVAFVSSWPVTMACILAIPLFGYTASRLGKRAKTASRRSQEQGATLTAQMEETLIGRRVVQAYGGEKHEIDRFSVILNKNLKQESRVARASAATPAAMEIAGAIALAGLLVFSSHMTEKGVIDGGGAFVAVVALLFLFTHVRRIGQLNTAVQQALAAARRIFEVLDEPIAVQEPASPKPLPPFSGAIQFENVHFDYGRGGVIHGVDLAIKAGEVHAFVGPSGAGKTTLAMMIPRFIDPTAGRVTIDGVDLKAVSLKELRRQIALVSQETHLFDDSVRGNIAYARGDASAEEIIEAAKAAHADEFIRALPNGYDTNLGERGTQLSAGQRQRLAIARAFLKNAPILVLDEATSALDSASEHEVQKALDGLLAGRTALIIAHRLSTIARADRIHVLQKGAVVESGRHEELLARGGPYARLRELQQT